jgi:hypothetical protein
MKQLNLFESFLAEAKIIGKIDLPQQADSDKITKQDLNALERALDALFGKINLDIEFTNHWKERINDVRNNPHITIEEVKQMFQKIFSKYKDILNNPKIDWQAVLKDMKSDINIPFVIQHDKKEGLQLVTKTIMRKKNFKSPNDFLTVT